MCSANEIQRLLANILLGIGIVALLITLFVMWLIPAWVLILIAVIAAILIVPPMLRVKRSQDMVQFQGSFQVPVQIAAAVGMLVWFIGPWLISTLRIG